MLTMRRLHSWKLDPRSAAEVQDSLSGRLRLTANPYRPGLVAGVDVSGEDGEGWLHAAVVVIHVPSMRIKQIARSVARPLSPYVPGLLSFREIPALSKAFKLVSEKPDMLVVDGQDLAHPRRFGLACHLGLLLGLPSIGCAKSRLIGTYEIPLDREGAWSPLKDRHEIIGAVLRTRKGARPVFVSPGNLIDLPSALEWVIQCGRGYRLPEPTRLAHLAVS
jgi:deoxyribonuclease V